MIDIYEDDLMTFCYEMSKAKSIGKCYSNVSKVVTEYWNEYIHHSLRANWMMISGYEGDLKLVDCGDICDPDDNYDRRLFQYIKHHTSSPYVFSYRMSKSGKYLLTVIARATYMDKSALDAFLNKLNSIIKELK